MEKLERWSEDMKLSLEQEIKTLDAEILEAKKASKSAMALAEKLVAQKQVKSLESTRKQKRQRLFEAQDEVDGQRDILIEKIEAQLKERHSLLSMFTVRWEII